MRKASLFITAILLANFLLAAYSSYTSLPPAAAQTPKAEVNFVSLDMFDSTVRTGSMDGGMDLYIRADNLPDDLSTVSISIGGQDCPINWGFTFSFQVACTVPAPFSAGKAKIVFSVDGVEGTCPESLCYLTYDINQTPVLKHIVPTAVTPNNPIKTGGNFRVDTSSLLEVTLSQFYCNFDLYGDQSINPDGVSFVQCQIDALPTGKYTSAVSTLLKGQAFKALSAQSIPDATYQPSDFIVAPEIKKLSSNSGPASGEEIIITGSGFSSVAKQNVVLYETYPCLVMSSVYTSIRCALLAPPSFASNTLRAGHAGLLQRVFGAKSNLDQLKADNSYKNGGGTKGRLLTFETPYNNRDDASESIEGFFKAPVDGNYRFLLSSRGPAELYISQTPLSTDNLELISSVSSASNFRDFYTPGENLQVSKQVLLQAGKFYYLQALHLAQGEDHLTVGVRIPTTTRNSYSVKKVVSVTLQSDVQRLEVMLRIKKSTTAFTVKQHGNNGDAESTTKITYPGTTSSIVAAFAEIGISVSVISQTFTNEGGNNVVAEAVAERSVYRLKFYTGPGYNPLPKSNPANAVIIQKNGDVDPTDLVEGSFELNVMGTNVPINYDSSNEDIEAALNTALGVDFSARVLSYGRADEGRKFVIYCNGNTDPVSDFTLANNALSGGKTGVQVIIQTLQSDLGTHTLLIPIPTDLLRTAEKEPQITVKTNGILAACSGNCQYKPAAAAPEVCITLMSYTLNARILELTLSNALDKQLQDFDSVEFGLTACTLKSYDAPTQKLVCEYAANENGSPRMVAGIFTPQVKLATKKYTCVDPGVQPTTVLETIVTLSAKEVADGFLEFTATGNFYGLGLGSTIRYGTEVVIGGVPCVLTDLTNNMLVCKAEMTVTDGPFVLTVNGLTVEAPFTFKKQEIIKEVVDDCYIDFKGENFVDETVVSLVNDATGYSERCRSCLRTSTVIRCATCGLPPGDYTAYLSTVLSQEDSWQATQPFKIVFEVNSISPSVGSALGGTVLTLTGFGFSDTLNKNQVSLGSIDGVKMLRCDVLTSSQKELTCRVAVNNIGLTGKQDVQAIQGLEFYGNCNGDCSFTLDDAYTPQITSASSYTIRVGDQVTILGTKFTDKTEVKFGGILATVVSFVANQQIIVTVPEITASDSVLFAVYDPTIGYYSVSGDVKFSSPLTLKSVDTITGSQAGSVITLTGSGFSNTATVAVGGKSCKITSVKSSEIICTTATSSSGSVAVTQDSKTAKCATDCIFTSTAPMTPSATLTTALASGTLTVTLSGSKLDIGTPITATLVSNSITQPLALQTSSTLITGTITNPIPGSYVLDVKIGNHLVSYEQGSSSLTVEIPITQASGVVATTQVSQAGGLDLEIDFAYLTLPTDASLVSVKIAGFDCLVHTVNSASLICTIPPLIVPEVPDLATEGLLKGNLIADKQTDKPGLAFDGDTGTSFVGADDNCFIGLDVGEGLKAKVSQIKFYPKPGTDVSKLQGGVFEASIDGTTYKELVKLDHTIYEGYNTLIVNSGSTDIFRWIRFRKSDATSRCEIAELKFKGTLYSTVSDPTPQTQVNIPKATVTINGVTSKDINVNIAYLETLTPEVTSISPKTGTSAGGTVVTIKGDKFGADMTKVEVYIDGTKCIISSLTNQQITCTTGELPAVADRTERLTGAITVIVQGKGAAVAEGVKFLYAERWSDSRTWGCDGLPITGDSVHVPIGMNLLVDITVPKLVAVVVEGSIIFEDVDNHFQCEYMMIRNGLLQVGTEEEPIQNNIVITIKGDRENKQLPIFGNKAIALYEGVIDIHGKKRTVPTTTLSQCSKAGDVDIFVEDPTSLEAGDEIAISSTSTDPSQNERRTIVCVVGNVITLDYALDYDHISESQTFDLGDGTNEVIDVKAIVAVLTRNVVIEGDDESEENKYGVHMLFFDPGTQKTTVRIENAEIRYAGQAGYAGRHPINFQNAGIQMNSYIKGCSIHDTYHRGIQLRATQYLTISNNVLFNTENEAIYLSDGSEKFNVIEDNTIIQVTASLFRYNSYRNPGGIRVANPLNFLRRNTIAGVVRNGFTMSYYTKAQGSSSGASICPQGEMLGAFEDNSVISAGSVGLFIDSHFPRTYPCRNYRNNDANPFDINPPVLASYKDFTAVRTQIGIQAWNFGRVELDGFKIADSTVGAIEVRHALYAPLNGTRARDGFIAGNLKLDCGTIDIGSAWGINVPGTEGFVVSDVFFANFESDSPALLGCSNCANAWEDTASRTTFVQGVKFSDVEKKVAFTAPFTHIFKDLDGSLTNGNGGTVVYNFPHLRVDDCVADDDVFSGLVCNECIDVRGVNFWNIAPGYLREKQLGIVRLEKDIIPAKPDFSYTSYRYKYGGYSAPFITGHPYQISIDLNLDFDSWKIETSPYSIADDLPITFVFNYTEPREDYDVVRRVFQSTSEDNNADVSNLTLITDIYSSDSMKTFAFGEFNNDDVNKKFFFALTGNNIGNQPVYDRPDVAYAAITAWRCKENCPDPFAYVPPSNMRKWSDPEGWKATFGEARLPKDGESVVIPQTDSVLLDVDATGLHTLEIDGELVFDETRETSILEAKIIWVRGKLIAGSETDRFEKKIIIRLTGTRVDEPIVVNSAVDAGTKVLVVTGEVNLFGLDVNPIARLTQNVNKGGDVIFVDGDISKWNKGDEILIASSSKTNTEYETRLIDDINGNQITLNKGVNYFHHGGCSGVQSLASQQVDLRTEVLLLTRNIQIEGTTQDGLGGRVLVTSEYGDNDEVKTGVLNLYSTSLSNCGQASTDRAGLTFESAPEPRTTDGTDTQSIVHRNVIRQAKSYGVRFEDASSVEFTENIVFEPSHYGIKLTYSNNQITIDSNIIVGVTGYPNAPIISLTHFSAGICIYDSGNTNIVITDNIVTSFTFSGYLISSEYFAQFTGNAVHGGKYGLIAYGDKISALTVSDFTAYRNNYGIISYYRVNQVTVKKSVFIENSISVNLASSADNERHFIIKDSYFKGVETCFSNFVDTLCSNQAAIAFNIFTIETRPDAFAFHRSNRDLVLGSDYVLSNNEFVNFEDGVSTYCSDNKVLKLSNQAKDFVPFIKVSGTKTTSIDTDSLALFRPYLVDDPNCGTETQCTLVLNSLIKDTDGKLIGTNRPGVLFPDDGGVADATCERNSKINGYICDSGDWALLGFRNLDSDKQTIVLDPIEISNEDGFFNKVNSHRNNYPTYPGDLQRYTTVVKADKSYNVIFPYDIPVGVEFQLQGETTDYALLKIKYFSGRVLNVYNSATGQYSDPIVATPSNTPELKTTDTCGTYIFDRTEGTIQFKITGEANCVLQVQQSNSLVASIRYDISIDEFFEQGGVAPFIDKVAAVLGIPSRRIRVVQIYKGSTVVVFLLDSDHQGVDSRDQAEEELATLSGSLESAVTNGTLDMYGAPVLDFNQNISLIPAKLVAPPVVNPPTEVTTETTSSSNALFYGLVIALPIAAVATAGILFYRYKKNSKKHRSVVKIAPEVNHQPVAAESQSNVESIKEARGKKRETGTGQLSGESRNHLATNQGSLDSFGNLDELNAAKKLAIKGKAMESKLETIPEKPGRRMSIEEKIEDLS